MKKNIILIFFILIIIGILIIVFYNGRQKGLSETTNDVNMESHVEVKSQKVSNITVEPHLDEITGIKYVTYEDFGAKSQEGYDDYYVIKATHEYANENNCEVRAEEGKTYHIYRLEETAPIIIQTNTNWNNANIVIHDEYINDNDTRNYAIFQITTGVNDITINDDAILDKIDINQQTRKIEELSGYGNCLCIVYNANKKQYIRSGEDEDSGADQEDLFEIDNEGKVLNDIQWDFDSITSIKLIKIPEKTITIENANFTTILPETDYEQESAYFNRSIECKRSNTIIQNIHHGVNNTERVAGPYYGFIKIFYVADVELKNSTLYAHKYNKKSNYDLIIANAINIVIDNVTSDNIEDDSRWGITGSNYTKDITYRNCVLNRIDAHCGVYNLNIEDCIIGIKGLSLIGAGKLDIKNSTRVGGTTFIQLRSDYGSWWNGTISITDCKFNTSKADSIFSYKVMYNSDGSLHDYGYDKVLPNLNIDNLQIEESEENESVMYVFYNNEYYTGNEEGNLINAGYTLPEYITINNYSVNTGKRIKAFYQNFSGSEQVNVKIDIPDRAKLQMTYEDGSQYESGKLTNNSVRLQLQSAKNVTNEIFINNEFINGNDILIRGSGIFNIIVKATDVAGNTAQDEYVVNIDKDGPKITGVENGQVYFDSVTPIISDENSLGQVALYLNNNIVNTYKPNNTITNYGLYRLEATDSLGNTTVINFEIANDNIEEIISQYIITQSKYIKEIDNNTSVNNFFENAKISKSFKIYNGDKQLSENDIIKNGDRLVVNNKEYVLIVKGDANCDGNVNIMDLMIIQRAIIKNTSLEKNIFESADVNNDNKVNIMDVMNIIRIIISE